LAQQIASSRPRSREHKKRRRSFFAYQGDQPVAEIFLSIISLKEDIPINIVFTDTAFCCLFEHFFIRSHDAVIADACRQYFIVFACLHFALEVVKFSHKLRFVSCFRMFFFKNRNALTLHIRPGFLAHSVRNRYSLRCTNGNVIWRRGVLPFFSFRFHYMELWISQTVYCYF